jgi:hypothetical protein
LKRPSHDELKQKVKDAEDALREELWSYDQVAAEINEQVAAAEEALRGELWSQDEVNEKVAATEEALRPELWSHDEVIVEVDEKIAIAEQTLRDRLWSQEEVDEAVAAAGLWSQEEVDDAVAAAEEVLRSRLLRAIGETSQAPVQESAATAQTQPERGKSMHPVVRRTRRRVVLEEAASSDDRQTSQRGDSEIQEPETTQGESAQASQRGSPVLGASAMQEPEATQHEADDATQDAGDEEEEPAPRRVAERGRPKSNAKKREDPLPWVVRNRDDTGYDSGVSLAPVTKRTFEQALATMASNVKFREYHTRYVRAKNLSGAYCVQCCVIKRNKHTCVLEDGTVACESCMSAGRPCAKLITHEGRPMLAWLPLSEDARGDNVSWQDVGYWSTQ